MSARSVRTKTSTRTNVVVGVITLGAIAAAAGLIFVKLLGGPIPVKPSQVTNPGQQTANGYGMPGYIGPGYTTPGYSAPGYTTPGYSGYGYDAPGYTTPGYSTPGYTPPDSPRQRSGYVSPQGYRTPADSPRH